jgi:hypothetical protein
MTAMYHIRMCLIAALVLFGLSGCATYKYTEAAPVQQQPISVQISNEELSRMNDMPIGVYKVPDSQVVISGHQKGAGGALLFGLLGVAIADAANMSAGSKSVHDIENVLRIKLNDQVQAAVKQAIAAGHLEQQLTQDVAPGPKLMLQPELVMSFVSDTDMRVFIELKTTLVGADKKTLWTTRYIASSGPARPLTGADSWTDYEGKNLKSAVQANLDQAVRVMLADVSHPYPRDQNQLTLVEGNFPYVKPKLQVVGMQLSEDEHYVVFTPRLGDVLVFAGVNVFDKTAITYRPATKDDAKFKILQ